MSITTKPLLIPIKRTIDLNGKGPLDIEQIVDDIFTIPDDSPLIPAIEEVIHRLTSEQDIDSLVAFFLKKRDLITEQIKQASAQGKTSIDVDFSLLFGTEESETLGEYNTLIGGYTIGSNTYANGLAGDDELFGEGNNYLVGGAGNDKIEAYDGVNVLDGGTGDDILRGEGTLIGGQGNDYLFANERQSADVFIFNKGDGSDSILETTQSVSNTANDLLKFLDIKASELWFQKVGSDLKISIIGSPSDSIIVQKWFASGIYSRKIETIKTSDGGTLTFDKVQGLVDAMSQYSSIPSALPTPNISDPKSIKLNDALYQAWSGVIGADGHLGDDNYTITASTGNSAITEIADGGIDTVISSVTHTLGNNIENLTLTGTKPLFGYGNELNNKIIGNAADNYLSGEAGADTLIGGLGNDTYGVDNTGDKIIENLSEGIDTVQSSVSYTLSDNIENLMLTGTAAINATGNASNNLLAGNAANNTLTGGAGNDAYLFNVDGAKDTIVDTSGIDTLTFGAGINANQLWLQHTGNDLVVSRIGTADSVTIKDWYPQTITKNTHLGFTNISVFGWNLTPTKNTHVETLKSGDGKTLLEDRVDNLVQAMASFAVPSIGTTTLSTNYQTALNTVIAASWK